jgi:hypothetical protein
MGWSRDAAGVGHFYRLIFDRLTAEGVTTETMPRIINEEYEQVDVRRLRLVVVSRK